MRGSKNLFDLTYWKNIPCPVGRERAEGIAELVLSFSSDTMEEGMIRK